MEVFCEWLAKARPALDLGGLRRVLHFARVVRPTDAAYRVPEQRQCGFGNTSETGSVSPRRNTNGTGSGSPGSWPFRIQ